MCFLMATQPTGIRHRHVTTTYMTQLNIRLSQTKLPQNSQMATVEQQQQTCSLQAFDGLKVPKTGSAANSTKTCLEFFH